MLPRNDLNILSVLTFWPTQKYISIRVLQRSLKKESSTTYLVTQKLY